MKERDMRVDAVLTDDDLIAAAMRPMEAALLHGGRQPTALDMIRAIEQAVLQSVSQWQPIDTAPKDGKPRLLFARLKSATASTIVVGSLIGDEWLAQSYAGQGKAVLVPSHWMPLPPFPATSRPGQP